MQRAVTSEVARLTAFETGDHRGRSLIDRLSRETASRSTARANSPDQYVCGAAVYLPSPPCAMRRPPPAKDQNFLWFVLPGPSHFELMLNLKFELGGNSTSHSVSIMTAAGPPL